jgi:hypothetical protein
MNEIVKAEGNTLATKMQYAQAMAGSSLLPRDYQGKPANLLFALEYADALGIAPIHAITSIHVINGKPSASADLIAASVRRAGHKLRVTGDDTYAEAVLIRSDDPDFEYVARWDMAKAKQANLNTATWKAYPAAMLRSRAITEVARMGASDALYGVLHTPEELGAEVDKTGAPINVPNLPAKSRVHQAMAEADEPVEETAAQPEDLGERVERDWITEAAELSDVDALRALWLDAQAAGAEQGILDSIRILATPADEPAAV